MSEWDPPHAKRLAELEAELERLEKSAATLLKLAERIEEQASVALMLLNRLKDMR